ncbi:MAG TPA: ribosome-associated ATPase/putative transporter RbbA [Methylosinus sp.]|jgi:ribosome-dependent ATPase|uniref:ribosome-associated ATPase/putative transporter RbbA n=1 Tax=Methylosinus sp. TaxID=427 RepID=UPI002F93CC74
MTAAEETKTPAAIQISGLYHDYGDVRGLENVSLSLPARATIAMIGPDGVGKSTLLGVIAGVKKIQAGAVHVLGADLRERREREAFLPHVAFMPQGLGRNLYPTLSVYENIDFFGRLFGLGAGRRDARIRRLLRATGLDPFPDRPAGKLSGGMKQKLALCCALVHDPRLLILDEPTTGVDPLSRRQFWELVDELRSESDQMTVIVATAYMEEAERFEYLVAMDNGRILIADAKTDVLARTGAATVEKAYVSLLPESRRAQASGVEIPPYRDPGGAPAIEAEALTRRFGDFVAVDNVSFRIGRGEIFGFLGSNGCGKSTTMKMLTGLLDATSGTAKLLGRTIDAGDMQTRLRVGYMSQSFSLYEELTVRQNLTLHARLYRVGGDRAQSLVDAALIDFALAEHADHSPASLPLGIRQRLQLAAACLHSPEVLILDEPTSGVDPGARDMFWRHLIRLSREKQVTIFLSTHFMNEAERCDRISLMHRGKVLAVGAPDELRREKDAATLEDAFILYLEQAEESASAAAPRPAPSPGEATRPEPELSDLFDDRATGWAGRILAFARRETMELARDPARLAFALLGPIVLLLVSAYSISFDVENIRFTNFDSDQTFASREFLRGFAGSRYFVEMAPSRNHAEMEARLRSHEAQLAIEIPPSFGRDLEAGRQPEVGFFIDGAAPFTASNIRAYATGVVLEYVRSLDRARAAASLPISVEPRFIYNQEFRSIYAITPGVVMLALILIPTMLTALGVVREKEIGSIVNLYASPATIGEFLVGKQLPYVGVAMVSYLSLTLITIFILRVPLHGSFLALTLGALLFILAVTALGLLISAFVRSQVAAIFGTAIICLIPSVNFSGLLYPISTLTGGAYAVGVGFPSSWFQIVSLGCFTKGLGLSSFAPNYLALGGFAALYLIGARLLLRKQEA